MARLSATAKLLIIGQAPGTRVQETSIPWDDRSADVLRGRLILDKDEFYDETRVAIVPTGFCYPSVNRRGADKPPRPEWAPPWHDALLDHLSAVKLVLMVRVYAQRRYLGRERKRTLTGMVVAWEIYAPHYIPLPHPNWRNNFSEIKPLVRRRHNADATRTCRTP